MKTPPAPHPGAQQEPARAKLKLWKKVLLISGGSLLGLVLIVLLFGPSVIASIVKSKIRAAVKETLGADATVGDVSFGWSGRVTLDGVKLVPPGFTRPLVEVKRIDVKIGLGAALGGRYIVQIEAIDPKVVVEKGPNGKFNYEFQRPAPEESGKGRKDGSSGEKPHVEAVLKVRGGELTIEGKNRTTRYQNLSVDAKVDTLEKPVEYSLSLESPEKDALKVHGSFDLEKQSGPATVKLEHFSLRNLSGAVRAYSDILELGGTVDGTLEYRLEGAPHFAGKGRLEIADFVLGMKDRTMRLDRLSFTHDVALDAKKVAKHTITLRSGKALDATILAEVEDPLGARKVRSELRVESDLPELARILRGLEALPPDLQLAGKMSLKGRTESEGPSDVDLKAGRMKIPAKLDFELSGKDLVVTLKKGEAPMKLDEFSFRHAGALDERGNGLHRITLESGKAVVSTVVVDVKDAFGTPELKADVKADSDLAELGKALQGLIGLQQDMRLEGRVAVKGSVVTKGPNLEEVKAGKKPVVAAALDLDLAASDLMAIDAGKKRLEIDTLISLKLKGSWDGKAKGDLETLKLSSSFATADAKGGATLKGEDVEIRPSSLRLDADLAKLNAKIGSFMKDPPRLAGTVAVDAKYAGEKVTVDAALKGVKAAFKDKAYGPIDVAIRDEGTMDKEANGRHVIRVESGKALVLTVTADLKNTLKETRSVVTDVKLDSDLGALLALLPPGTVELKPETDLAGAVALTAHAEAKGSNWAKFDVSLNASNLVSIERKTKKASEIDKAITLKATGTWDGAKKSIELPTFTLASSFASAEAKGGFVLTEPMSVRESSLQVRADLEKLGAKLGLFMADPPALSGTVGMNAAYAGDKYSLDARVEGVKVATKQTVKEGGKDVVKASTIGPIDVSVVQKGTLSLAPDGGLKIEACKIVSSALNADVSGEIRKVRSENREGEIKLDASVRPVELSKWMADLNLGGPEIRLAATVSMKPKLVTATGGTKLDGLTLTSKDPVTGKPVLKTAKTGPLDFSVVLKDKDIVGGVKAAHFEWIDAGYSAKGGVVADVTYTEKGSTGTTRITALEIVDDKKNVVKDPGVTLVHDIAMTPLSMEIRKAELSSTFIRGTLAGKVFDLDKPDKRVQGLVLDLKYHPDRLNAVLIPWMDGKKLEGAEEKSLKVTLDGVMKTSDMLAILRGATAGVDVDLAKFSMDGYTVSGKTHLGLQGGVLKTDNPIDVNQGRADLRATADFRPEGAGPRSELVLVAKDVRANAKMKVLQAINPIFHIDEKGESTVDGLIGADFKLTWTGRIDPDWGKTDWERAAVGSLKGTGVFAMKNMKIVGSPTITEIMVLLGEGNSIQGELVASQIDVGNRVPGWCRYDQMVLRLARYEIKFRGGVAFAATKHQTERAMDLEVEIPMTEHMIKSQPGLAKYLGQRFWIPLRGTVEHPVLDYKKLFLDLAKNAAGALIQDKAEDLLKKLLDGKKKKDK